MDTQSYLARFLILPHPLFHKLRILNIIDIFKLQLGNLVYEAVNRIGPSNKAIKSHRVSDIHCHNTSYADQGNLYINSARTTRFGLKGLHIEGSKLWAIPTDIKNCQSKKSFNYLFKKYMIYM